MVKYANDAYKNQVAQDLLAFQNASRQLQGSATVRGAMTSRGYANDLAAALQGQQLADEQARIMRDRHLGAAAQSGAAAGAAAVNITGIAGWNNLANCKTEIKTEFTKCVCPKN